MTDGEQSEQDGGTISVDGAKSSRPPEPRFRIVSSHPEAKDDVYIERKGETSSSSDGALSAEEEDVDDAFFARSFALNADRQESEQTATAFANGLRSLFESEDGGEDADRVEEEDASENEQFQRELDAERRESLDGVLRQNDADFIDEAGRKYDGSADAESEIAVDGIVNSAKIRPESILEAMLFVGDAENKPITLALACELMRNVSELEAMEALADLNERYFREGAPYKIVRDGDGFRLALLPQYQEFVARSGEKTRDFKLSQTAIDVLALVAYRQPIMHEEILETRSGAGPVLAQLVKRDLISAEKQTVDKKKVTFYKTTDRFLKVFNLESLDDLPIVGDIDYR